MKKLFFTLLILPVLFSCSSDDEKYDINEATFTINVEDFHPTAHELQTGYYYEPGNIILLTIGNKNNLEVCAVDAFCPAHTGSKKTIQYHYIINESSNNIEDFYVHCTSCKAKFEVKSGKAINNEAKGKSIGVYKTKTEIDDSGYGWTKVYIWK